MDNQAVNVEAEAVTPITNGKKRPRKKSPPKFSAGNPDDWNPVQIQNDIIEHVETLYERGELESEYPSIFAGYRRSRLLETDHDTIYKVDRDSKELFLVPFHDFEHLLQDFYRRLFRERYYGKAMSVGTQNATTKVLVKFLPRISHEEIKIFAFPDEDVYSWRRLDFKLLEPGVLIKARQGMEFDDDEPARPFPPQSWEWALAEIAAMCPAWYSFIRRCGNARAFVAWLGSLLDRECRNRQFVYLRGDGGDGKGTLGRALRRIFGPKLTHVENVPDKKSPALRFFTASLEGKLLLIAPDQGDDDLFSNPIFMSITGDDPLTIERKGRDTRNAVNYVRPIVFINHRLRPTNKPAHRRRIILVPVAPIEGEKVADFESELVDEAMFFFSLAHWVYENMPNRVEFVQDKRVYDENAEIVNDAAYDLIAKYFITTPRTEIDRRLGEGEPKNRLPHVRLADFEEYSKRVLPGLSPKKIRELLEEKFDISAKSEVVNIGQKKTAKCLIGVEPRYPHEIISRVMRENAEKVTVVTEVTEAGNH